MRRYHHTLSLMKRNLTTLDPHKRMSGIYIIDLVLFMRVLTKSICFDETKHSRLSNLQPILFILKELDRQFF